MAESTVELQKLIWQTLNDDAAVDCEIYDHVPESAQYPYITFGAETWQNEDADCIDEAFTVALQLDFWNDQPGRIQDIKPLMHAAIKSLKSNLSLVENALQRNEFILARIVRDPNGITTHGMLEFEFEVQET